ncbi:MAG TPA: ATP-binding protein [Candidatus Saccharimonadales bacterium]|nr:ATP-binding protein [Candidatus Saccharimonadales bacterium]
MRWDEAVQVETERSALRIRLVAVALGVTIVLLGAGPSSLPAALILAAYAALAVAFRFGGLRFPGRPVGSVAIAADALAVTLLVVVLPLSEPVWALYLAPIATAALRHGPAGVLGVAAVSVLGYDLALATRASGTIATDLWPVQLLLAAGLIVAELTWVRRREDDDHQRLRRREGALRDLAGATDLDALLDRLTRHLVDDGAVAAWIWRADGDVIRTEHGRGAVPDRPANGGDDFSVPDGFLLSLADDDEPLLLAASFPAGLRDRERRVAAARDLGADVRPLVNAAVANAIAREASVGRASFDAQLAALVGETTEIGLFAAGMVVANQVAGPAAIVRPADGVLLAGDLPAAAATTLARGVNAPGIARLLLEGTWSDEPLREVDARSAAVAALGEGLVLVAASRRRLRTADLSVLTTLGTLLGNGRRTLRDQERARDLAAAQAATIAEQRQALKAKDEAVAAALHELRTPLSSVDGYAQLMSRHLDSARRQISQLEHVLTDLQKPFEGRSTGGLDLQDVDLDREVKEAASRLRLTTRTEVDVHTPGGPVIARADPSRIAQVLDNLLTNAVKYSPDGGPVSVRLSGSETEVVIAVTDSGAGLAAGDLERVFERGYRVTRGSTAVAGQGLGLAISKMIVAAHGGRIWAASDGPGQGSTFTIALQRVP